MPGALEVAAFLVHLASAEEEPEFLGTLRLNRLLYYCQGWHLATCGRPLFPERIEAWATGPVVPVVYEALLCREWEPIRSEDLPASEPLAPADQDHVVGVWDAYKNFTGMKLRELACAEPPWLAARNGRSVPEQSDAEITLEAMTAYFGSLLRSSNKPVMGVAG